MVKLDKCARDNNGLFEVSFEIGDLDPEARYERGELSYANLLTIRMAEQELAQQIQEAREWRANSQNSDVLL